LGRQPVADVGVLQDLRERAAALVLADHVGGDALLARRAGEEKRERVAEDAGKLEHCARILSRCAAARRQGGSPSARSSPWTTPATRSGSSSGWSGSPARCGRSGGR